MPDGMTHFEIGAVCGVTALAAVWLTEPAVMRPAVIGTVIGLIVTPDLDQEGTTFTERALWAIPVVGWLVGLAFQWSWYGYARLFRHRGWSHNLLVGTVSRVVFAALIVGFWLWVWWLTQGAPAEWWTETVAVVVREIHPALFVAWWLQDALHVLADALL